MSAVISQVAVRERPILFSAPMVRAILGGKKTQTRRIVNIERLRVRLRRAVESDLAEYLPASERLHAKPGVYTARIYEHGAVAVLLGEKGLGVKPREFDFECPYADGETILESGGGWRILPAVGQRLWVKETWCENYFGDDQPGTMKHGYRADFDRDRIGDVVPEPKWTPSIFMPRWASRITLEVTGVRVERLQDISEEDARAEGVSSGRVPVDDYGPERIGYVLGPDDGKCLLYPTEREAFAVGWDLINGKRAPWASNPWVWVVEFRRVSP